MKLHIFIFNILVMIFGGDSNLYVGGFLTTTRTINSKAQQQEDKHSIKIRSLRNDGPGKRGFLDYQPPIMDSKEFIGNAFPIYENAELSANTYDGQQFEVSPRESDYTDRIYDDLDPNKANKYNKLKDLENTLLNEQKNIDKSALLLKMLEDPTSDTLPIIYIEEESVPPISTMDYIEYNRDETFGNALSKRSRYYNNFPWKRHNRNRGNFLPEMRFACTPTKEDIFKLLLNLQENRKGNQQKSVTFCNRQRPSWSILKNIRVLG